MEKKMNQIKRIRGKRVAAAAVSGLLAAAVLITAVLSNTLEVEAAETFYGIEQLWKEVAERTKNGESYTVLEVVPDRNAAEIGFLFDGYEPLLSTWEWDDENTGHWKSWREQLCSLASFEDRKKYVEGLKVQLAAYYEEKGIKDTVPVQIAEEEYEESDEPKQGFEQIAEEAVQKTGWFTKAVGEKETFQLKFTYQGTSINYSDESGWVYYKISGNPVDLNTLSSEERNALPADTVIYKKEVGEGVFSIAGLWGELTADEPETEQETQTEPETEKTPETDGTQEPEKEPETQEPTEPVSEPEKEPETQEPTEPVSEPEKEPETQEPTEPVSEPEKEPETQEPTEPVSEPEKETETQTIPASETAQSTAALNLVAAPEEESQAEESVSAPAEESQTEESVSAPAEESQTEESVSIPTEESQTEESVSIPTEESQTEESRSAAAADNSAADFQLVPETYYLVSFERIRNAEELSDNDTIYVVNDDGILPSNHGEYAFVESDDEKEKKQTYTFSGVILYCKNALTNNEWFKKNAIDMEKGKYDEFSVQVLTYTPAELNAMAELPQFDFLYLNSGTRLINSEAETEVYNEQTMDLSTDVVKELFVKITANGTPCLVDGAIMYESDAETGTVQTIGEMKNTQIFLLTALLCQKSLDDWSQYAGNPSALLIPNLLAGITDGDKNFATEQTYCRFGMDSIINSDFAKPSKHIGEKEVEEGFQGVLDEINLENLYRESDKGNDYEKLSTDISEARVLRHIINYKNRRTTEAKKVINVLEIQPALTSAPEITEEQIKAWAPGVEEVHTTIMTTAEFIGKIDKLNDQYDLIYIGTSKEHLNMAKVDKNSEWGKTTVFNDKDMDGLIYYNVGDLRVVYVAMAGLLDSEYWNGNRNDWTYYYNYVRYGGNDITKEKMEALNSFLDGSYPVIISDDFMKKPVAATFYKDANYKGNSATLTEGSYTLKELNENGIPGGEITSLKVTEGYQVTLYKGENFDGEAKTFGKDSGWVGGNWNDKCNSVIIEKLNQEQTEKQVDGDKIDNCTYLYEFVEGALEKKYTNFYVKSEIEDNSELFKFYLNRPKADLVNFTANGNRGGADGQNDAYYIEPAANGKYNLSYSFTIKNEGAATADTKYYCKLYVDVNADGKFSDQEEVGDVTITNQGGGVSAQELYADKEYVLTREVPQGYKGLLPWKVEICQVNNSNIYTSETGYTKLEGMEQEILKICQIYKNNSAVVNLKDEIGRGDSPFHILIYGGDYEGVHYEGISDDFLIDVTPMSVNEFRQKYRENKDCLKDFNMLILGFSDMYDDFDGDETTGSMSAIVEFINSGKSVLLSHDTTSFFNNPNKNGQKGYTNRNNKGSLKNMHSGIRNAAALNTYIRPLVGMDRYGVLNIPALKKGVVLREGDEGWNDVINSGKDVAYKPKSGRKETVPEVQGYTYSLISAKDSKEANSTGAIQSFSRNEIYSKEYGSYDATPRDWRFTNTYRNIRYDQVFYTKDVCRDENEASYGEVINPDNGAVTNVHVTQVNKGQITEYPYKLKEDFEVATTHAQYYELDYTADDDHDGQSDLVVWYCLGGRTSNNNRGETIYSQSPNDVRNNYYIYNKGNITYTGMGHSAGDKTRYTFEEAKLFINTMIASYQAGVKPPYISVKENGLTGSAEIATMYRFYDEANGISLSDDASAQDSEKLYFTVQDINFVKGTRKITSHVYYKNAGGDTTITVNGTEIQATKLEDRIYNASTGEAVAADNLQSGGIYYILVPKTVMQNCDAGLQLYFEAQSVITSNSNTYITDKTYAELEVLKAYLFDLD